MPEEPTITDEQLRGDLDRKKAEKEAIREKFLRQIAKAQASQKTPIVRDSKGFFTSPTGKKSPPKQIDADRPKVQTATGQRADQEVRFELKFRKPPGLGREVPGQGMGLPPVWLRGIHRKKPRKDKAV